MRGSRHEGGYPHRWPLVRRPGTLAEYGRPVLGFYQALRQAGPLLLIAVVAFLTGFLFILAHEFIRLGIAYELAPGIAEASAATRASLEVMADTLRQTSWLAAGVGFVLIFGIGVLLFSFAILRTSVVPKWIGWLGLINVAANTALVTILSGVFDSSIRPSLAVRFGNLPRVGVSHGSSPATAEGARGSGI